VTELSISICEADWSSPDAERDLIERAKYDREAFAVLYRRHYGAIVGYVYRRVRDTHTTEDLVAEVFLAVVRSMRRYRHRGVPFRSWLYRIATNVVNRWARRQRRWLALTWQDPVAASSSQEGEPSAEGETERARRAMLSLSPKHQTVLSLHYLEGLSLEEVAAVIGCRVGTVNSRLSRGRKALREVLTKGR
jgi:RNA polymerase sigma-70 factor (ECF subfamily)